MVNDNNLARCISVTAYFDALEGKKSWNLSTSQSCGGTAIVTAPKLEIKWKSSVSRWVVDEIKSDIEIVAGTVVVQFFLKMLNKIIVKLYRRIVNIHVRFLLTYNLPRKEKL